MFDSVRDPEMEKEAPFKIEIEIDSSFDYQTLKSNKYTMESYTNILVK
jgi:hypothetical protein